MKELCCGRIVSRANVSTVELEVTKLSDLTEIIIPLFSKYSLHAPCSARGYRDKIKDFEDFKKVAIRGTLALPRLSDARCHSRAPHKTYEKQIPLNIRGDRRNKTSKIRNE